MHIRIMNIQSHLLREHHACHTSWYRIQLTFCLFRTKIKYKDNCDQRSWFQIRFLGLARVYLLTTNSRLDSCILPWHVWRVRRSDTCILPGCIYWRLFAGLDSCILPGCICWRLFSGLDSCILPGHIWRVWRSDSCILPGCIYWRLFSRFDSCI